MEAKLRKEAELRQEAKMWKESELRRTNFETAEEGEGSRMGALEEEEAWDKDNEEDGNEGKTTSEEDTNRPNKDAERYNNVSNGEEGLRPGH